MPLIDLTSDLRMYRPPTIGTFDRRGGGSSNQPYTLPKRAMGIPNDIRDTNESKLPRLGLTGGLDLFNRGGLNAPRRALIDTSRLAQYFFDLKGMAGPLFLVKQNLLSRTSVKTEASFGPGYGAGSLTADKTNSFEKGVFVNEKGGFMNQGLIPGSYLITPLGILGQSLGGWAGLHLNAFGLDPTSPMTGVVGRSGAAGINRYSEVIQLQNQDQEYLVRNRLIGLYEGKIINEDETQVILEYGGGPGAILGVGKTRIPRFTFTGFNNPKVKSDLEKGVGERSNTIVVKDKGYLPGLTHWDPFTVPYDYYNVLEYGSDEEGFNPPNRGASFRYNQMYPDVDLNQDVQLNLNNSDDGLLVRQNNTVYANTSSLDPREDIKTYQTGQQYNRTIDDSQVPLGASKMFNTFVSGTFDDSDVEREENQIKDQIGWSGIANESTDNGYRTTLEGTFIPNTFNQQKTRNPITLDVRNLLGASNYFSLLSSGPDNDQNLVNLDDKFDSIDRKTATLTELANKRWYAPTFNEFSNHLNREGQNTNYYGIRLDNTLNSTFVNRENIGEYLVNSPSYYFSDNRNRFSSRDPRQLLVIGELNMAYIAGDDGGFFGEGVNASSYYMGALKLMGLPYESSMEFNSLGQFGRRYQTNIYDVQYGLLTNVQAFDPLLYPQLTRTMTQQQLFTYGNQFGNLGFTNRLPFDFKRPILRDTYGIETNEVKLKDSEGNPILDPDGEPTLIPFSGTYSKKPQAPDEVVPQKNKVGVKQKSDEVVVQSRTLSISPDYKRRGGRTRVNMGDPGHQNTINGEKNVINYGVSAKDQFHRAVDKINAQPMYESSGPAVGRAINDYAKFRICALNNDKANGSGTYMHFRAFIDSFSDNYSATWTPVQYSGRGDSFYNYGGFGRTINMAFTVYAQSKAELTPMYKKLNFLASTLAPDYNSAGFMRGNLVRLTLGGYIYETPGFITSITYDVPQECTWEIAIDENGAADSSVKELPHMIKVTGLSFTPIHNFLVQKPNNPRLPQERYISLSTRFNHAGLYRDMYKKYDANANSIIPGEGDLGGVDSADQTLSTGTGTLNTFDFDKPKK